MGTGSCRAAVAVKVSVPAPMPAAVGLPGSRGAARSTQGGRAGSALAMMMTACCIPVLVIAIALMATGTASPAYREAVAVPPSPRA